MLCSASNLLADDATLDVNRLDDVNGFMAALDKAACWKLRCVDRLPHSVETTYCLALCLWNDARSVVGSSTTSRRNEYGSSVVRGVNGLADVLQQRRAVAASVSYLCSQIGLPAWLVDIRHDAAHNQLASLTTLRLAAQTFLGFLHERYWQAVSQKTNKHRETAAALLAQYKKLAKERPPPELRHDDDAQPLKEALVPTNRDGDTHGDQPVSDAEEEWQEDEADILWGKAIGTNHNRFAAFSQRPQEQPKGKQPRGKQPKNKHPKATNEKRKGHSPLAEGKQPQSKKCKSGEEKPKILTALDVAQRFVQTVPVDIGHQTALIFLVWGGTGGSPSGRGALVPGNPTAYATTKDGYRKFQPRYKSLLLYICRAWPGFHPALLVHTVDCMLSIEGAAQEKNLDDLDDASERKLFFLSCWIGFLLSRQVLLEQEHIDDVALGITDSTKNLRRKPLATYTEDETNFLESDAPWEALSQANLPLNSLCDRLEADNNNNKSNPKLCRFSRAVADRFNHVLGTNRIPHHGIDLEELARPLDVRPLDNPETGDGTSMSLEQMEAMLESDDREETTTSTQPKRPRWVRCKSWDACAIGTLPGYPA